MDAFCAEKVDFGNPPKNAKRWKDKRQVRMGDDGKMFKIVTRTYTFKDGSTKEVVK